MARGGKKSGARKSQNANGAADAQRAQAAAEAKDPNSPMRKVSSTQAEAENKNAAMIWGGEKKPAAETPKEAKPDRKKAVLKLGGVTKITREAGKEGDGLPQSKDVVQQGGGGIAVPAAGSTITR